MFFRLRTRAPRTAIQSCAIVLLRGLGREPQLVILCQRPQNVVSILANIWRGTQRPYRDTEGSAHCAQARSADHGSARGNVGSENASAGVFTGDRHTSRPSKNASHSAWVRLPKRLAHSRRTIA